MPCLLATDRYALAYHPDDEDVHFLTNVDELGQIITNILFRYGEKKGYLLRSAEEMQVTDYVAPADATTTMPRVITIPNSLM